jgi:predicted RecA/RadA family phage recombinase
MSTNYNGPGNTMDYDNAGAAIASGDVVVVGNIIGVAHDAIPATTGTGVLHVTGEFSLPKVSAAVIAQGETVIFDVSVGEVDDNAATPATGDINPCGYATEAAGNGVTSVLVQINAIPGAVT